MEEDILNYSPTVMFRGTPCALKNNRNISKEFFHAIQIIIIAIIKSMQRNVLLTKKTNVALKNLV